MDNPDITQMLETTQVHTGFQVSILLRILQTVGDTTFSEYRETFPGRFLLLAPTDDAFEPHIDDIDRFVASSIWKRHLDSLLRSLMSSYPYTQKEMIENGLTNIEMLGGSNFSISVSRDGLIFDGGQGRIIGPSPNARDG